MRAASRADFLLTGLIRCGRYRRAYIGMSAKGNGGTYRHYACSGRQKLGRKAAVCAPTSSVGETWLCANQALMAAPAGWID
jgi:hypothetical protein